MEGHPQSAFLVINKARFPFGVFEHAMITERVQWGGAECYKVLSCFQFHNCGNIVEGKAVTNTLRIESSVCAVSFVNTYYWVFTESNYFIL